MVYATAPFRPCSGRGHPPDGDQLAVQRLWRDAGCAARCFTGLPRPEGEITVGPGVHGHGMAIAE